MDVDERDRLAMADAATLRRAGFTVTSDFEDCCNPGPLWREWIEEEKATSRQLRALGALQGLTHDDVIALLEALR